MSIQPINITHAPNEIIVNILNDLNEEDLSIAAMACQLLSSLASDDTLWKRRLTERNIILIPSTAKWQVINLYKNYCALFKIAFPNKQLPKNTNIFSIKISLDSDAQKLDHLNLTHLFKCATQSYPLTIPLLVESSSNPTHWKGVALRNAARFLPNTITFYIEKGVVPDKDTLLFATEYAVDKVPLLLEKGAIPDLDCLLKAAARAPHLLEVFLKKNAIPTHELLVSVSALCPQYIDLIANALRKLNISEASIQASIAEGADLRQ